MAIKPETTPSGKKILRDEKSGALAGSIGSGKGKVPTPQAEIKALQDHLADVNHRSFSVDDADPELAKEYDAMRVKLDRALIGNALIALDDIKPGDQLNITVLLEDSSKPGVRREERIHGTIIDADTLNSLLVDGTYDASPTVKMRLLNVEKIASAMPSYFIKDNQKSINSADGTQRVNYISWRLDESTPEQKAEFVSLWKEVVESNRLTDIMERVDQATDLDGADTETLMPGFRAKIAASDEEGDESLSWRFALLVGMAVKLRDSISPSACR